MGSGHKGHPISRVRRRQLSDKVCDAALRGMRVPNKFKAAVHRPNARDSRLEFKRLVLIVQDDGPHAARCKVIQEVESHPLDTNIRASACEWLIGYRELSGKIDSEPWVSILESMHRLFVLVERWLDDSPQPSRMETHNCLMLEHC